MTTDVIHMAGENAVASLQPDVSRGLAVVRTAMATILAADDSDILGRLAKKVAAFQPDVSTPAGRDEMRSLAYEIRKSKTALIKLGKSLTEDWRAQTKAVNAECAVIEDRMDALSDRVRAPLTEWENREKDRVAAHISALSLVEGGPGYSTAETADELRLRLNYLMNLPLRDWEEFTERAAAAHAREIARTERLLAAEVKREAEEAELALLRAAEAERQLLAAIQVQEKREAQIAADAADKARRDAETKAARDAELIAKAARDRQEMAEREAEAAAFNAELQIRAMHEAAAAAQAREAKAEADRVEAVATAERERDAASAKATRDLAAQLAAERKRVADLKATEEATAAARAANVAHKKKIHNAIRGAINGVIDDCGAGGQDFAKSIAIALATGRIPHITINY